MNAIIDTSSLMVLVRYYLPFDNENKLKQLICSKFENGEFVVIDKVFIESEYQAKGLILQKLDFLKRGHKRIIKTEDVLPNRKFFNMMDHQFCNKDVLKASKLNNAEFESKRQEFLNGADAKLILYAQRLLNQNSLIPPKVVLVTEESATGNDGKIFRKIPDICSHLDIDCCSLPTLFKEHYKINLREFLH